MQPGWAWALPPVLGLPATAYTRDRDSSPPRRPPRPGRWPPATVDPGDVARRVPRADARPTSIWSGSTSTARCSRLWRSPTAWPTRTTPTLSDGLLPALRSSGISLLADDRGRSRCCRRSRTTRSSTPCCPGSRRCPLTAPRSHPGLPPGHLLRHHRDLAFPAPPRRHLPPGPRQRGPPGRGRGGLHPAGRGPARR